MPGAALTTFFHPLKGGEDGAGWPFGGEIFYSEVMRTILQVPGAARVLNNNLTIYLDDAKMPTCQDVPVCEGDLLYSGDHQIRVSYATR